MIPESFDGWLYYPTQWGYIRCGADIIRHRELPMVNKAYRDRLDAGQDQIPWRFNERV